MTLFDIEILYKKYEKALHDMQYWLKTNCKYNENILLTHQTHYSHPYYSLHLYKGKGGSKKFTCNGVVFNVEDGISVMDRDTIISFILNYGTTETKRYCIDDYTFDEKAT